MLVNLHQSAQNYNPEDGHLGTHRRENLKSHRHYEVYILIRLKSCNGHDYKFQYNFMDTLYLVSYMEKLRRGTKI
jgi:hypothetical protein